MRTPTLLVILICFILSVSAQDKILNVGLNFRTDYNIILNNHEKTTRDINLNTLKLIFYGTLHRGITYKIQQRLNDSWYLESDKYTSSLEDAWINFMLGKSKWDITVGKQDIMFGTFESLYDPSDMYLISMVFNNFNRSQVGIAARHTWSEGNRLSFQISNIAGEQLSYDEHHSFAYTVNASKTFFDDVLWTTLGYSLIQSGNSRFFHWFTFGSQLKVKKLFIELDAYAGRYRQNMTFDTSLDNFRESDNFSATIGERYQIRKFNIFTKFSIDYQKDVLEKSLSKRSYGVAVGTEYYPIDGQDLRIHAAYRLRHNHYGDMWLNTSGNEIINQFIVGLKWELDLGRLLTTLGK